MLISFDACIYIAKRARIPAFTKLEHFLSDAKKVLRFSNSASPEWESQNRLLPRLRKSGADTRKTMFYGGNGRHSNHLKEDIISVATAFALVL